MAHEYAMQHLENSGGKITMHSLCLFAWEYADAMQAEADKRSISLTKDKDGNCLHFHHEFGHERCMDCGASLDEWQPYWDLAPNGFDWWAMDSNKHAHFYSAEPFIDADNSEFNINAKSWADYSQLYISTKTFGYTGNWQDSLRKRPIDNHRA